MSQCLTQSGETASAEEAERLIQRAMAKRPADRFPQASDLAEAGELDGALGPASPMSMAKKLRDWKPPTTRTSVSTKSVLFWTWKRSNCG